jgi:hypothetical protein
MALPLRQSTASQEILLGPFVDDADGDTQMTALTIANTDIKIWKHGATTLADKNSGGATHIANGRYYATLDATDTDTIGMLEVIVHVADALPVRREYIVYDEAVYDVLFGTTAPSTLTAAQVNTEVDTALTDIHLDHLIATAASIPAITSGTYLDQIMDDGTAAYDRTTDSLQAIRDRGDSAWASEAGHTAADVWAVATRTITGGTIATLDTGSITAGSFATDAIDSNALAENAAQEIADYVWDEDATGHQTQGTFGQAIGDPAADTNTIFKAVVTDATGATVGVDGAAILADTGTDGVVVAAGSKTGYTLSSAGLADFFDTDSGTTYASAVAGSVVAEIADNAGGGGLDAAGVRAAVGLASANLDTQLDTLPTAAENASAVLTTQMTESYAADGAAPTVAQALHLIQQMLTEFGIVTTTLTVKKLDGSTTAATFTLNDADSPTSVTRAS